MAESEPMIGWRALLASMVALSACDSARLATRHDAAVLPPSDAGLDARETLDAATHDLGSSDAATLDLGTADAGAPDLGTPALDGSMPDAGPDAAERDAGSDAAPPEAGCATSPTCGDGIGAGCGRTPFAEVAISASRVVPLTSAHGAPGALAVALGPSFGTPADAIVAVMQPGGDVVIASVETTTDEVVREVVQLDVLYGAGLTPPSGVEALAVASDGAHTALGMMTSSSVIIDDVTALPTPASRLADVALGATHGGALGLTASADRTGLPPPAFVGAWPGLREASGPPLDVPAGTVGTLLAAADDGADYSIFLDDFAVETDAPWVGMAAHVGLARYAGEHFVLGTFHRATTFGGGADAMTLPELSPIAPNRRGALVRLRETSGVIPFAALVPVSLGTQISPFACPPNGRFDTLVCTWPLASSSAVSPLALDLLAAAGVGEQVVVGSIATTGDHAELRILELGRVPAIFAAPWLALPVPEGLPADAHPVDLALTSTIGPEGATFLVAVLFADTTAADGPAHLQVTVVRVCDAI